MEQNLKSSSFIVVRELNGEKYLSSRQETLLKKRGFKHTNISNPLVYFFTPQIKRPKKDSYMGVKIQGNQDETIGFFIENRISFMGIVEDGIRSIVYDKTDKHVFIFRNPGLEYLNHPYQREVLSYQIDTREEKADQDDMLWLVKKVPITKYLFEFIEPEKAFGEKE